MNPGTYVIPKHGRVATSPAAKFFKSLLQIWRPPTATRGLPGPVRFALAVSGGSDSMALVRLCCQLREFREQYPVLQFLRLHAFIVDHKARPDSTEEAKRVRKWLHEQFGPNKKDSLRSDILTLQWPHGVIPSELPNFETEARRLRYQALGKACHEANIPNLLLGHHKADKKETSIIRLIEGYRGAGLRGIPTESDIPDCEGIYGAYQSGGRGYTTTQNKSAKALFSKHRGAEEMLPPMKEYRKQGFEFGGVRTYRPLLTFSKRDLQTTLKEANIPWVEDPTNQDPTVSVRNAVRLLLRNKTLPMALSGPADWNIYTLETAVENIHQKYFWRNKRADDFFQDLDILKFDSRVGSLEVRIRSMGLQSAFLNPTKNIEREHIGARLVRLLLQLVSPQDHISLQTLETATKNMFLDIDKELPDRGKQSGKAAHFTAGGVYCERFNLLNDDSGLKSKGSCKPVSLDYTWRLSRQPYQRSLPEPVCLVPPSQPSSYNPRAKKHQQLMYLEPPWQLWDGRYWIQVINSTIKPLKICPLTEDRLLRLKARFKSEGYKGKKKFGTLQMLLKEAAPGFSRFTLPAIVDDEDNVLVLPTLGFEVDGPTIIEWRIRYRRVAFPDSIKKEAVIALPERELMCVKPPAISAHHENIIAERREAKMQRKAEEIQEKREKRLQQENEMSTMDSMG
ncbi:MAG: hypothetical protein L6R36_005822 [Xanthoria steineri]|nr:MAG: hypothetical protein L6R36_005822 [Xanthoria steineri]